MLETPFPFFISKKSGEIQIFGSFLGEKNLGSLWHHMLTDCHDFDINEERRPYPILWYQTTILWVCQFQVHRGWHPPPKM